MSQRTVLEVDTSCAKFKRKVLLAVSSLRGVDKVEIDSEKGTMTVTGSVDPVDVVVATRKTGKRVDVVTIGPLPPPPSNAKPGEKKPDQKNLAAAAEKRAPDQPPVTVYVHHVPAPPPPWPVGHHEQCGVVYHYQQDPCSIM